MNCRHRKIFSLRDIFMEQVKKKKIHFETLILYSNVQSRHIYIRDVIKSGIKHPVDF